MKSCNTDNELDNLFALTDYVIDNVNTMESTMFTNSSLMIKAERRVYNLLDRIPEGSKFSFMRFSPTRA